MIILFQIKWKFPYYSDSSISTDSSTSTGSSTSGGGWTCWIGGAIGAAVKSIALGNNNLPSFVIYESNTLPSILSLILYKLLQILKCNRQIKAR